MNKQGFLTDGLACCGAGAGERAHRSIRVATAELGDLSLNLPCIGAADGVEVGWVRFSATSRVNSYIRLEMGVRLLDSSQKTGWWSCNNQFGGYGEEGEEES